MDIGDDDGWDFGTVRQSLPPAPKPSIPSAAPSRYSLGSYAGSTQSLASANSTTTVTHNNNNSNSHTRPLPLSPSSQQLKPLSNNNSNNNHSNSSSNRPFGLPRNSADSRVKKNYIYIYWLGGDLRI